MHAMRQRLCSTHIAIKCTDKLLMFGCFGLMCQEGTGCDGNCEYANGQLMHLGALSKEV